LIFHRHHVKPKHAGGTDEEENIVTLTLEEHAEAHRLLWEEYGRQEDYIAWMGLSGQIPKQEVIRLSQSLGGKKGRGKKIGEAHKAVFNRKGRTNSQEHRQKISASLTGRVVAESTKLALSKACRGKTRSEEARRNMSAAAKGKVWVNNGVMVTKINKEAVLPEGWMYGKKLRT